MLYRTGHLLEHRQLFGTDSKTAIHVSLVK